MATVCLQEVVLDLCDRHLAISPRCAMMINLSLFNDQITQRPSVTEVYSDWWCEFIPLFAKFFRRCVSPLRKYRE